MNTELITLYTQLRSERAALEAKAKEIKAAEDSLKAKILMELEAAGIDSAKAGGMTVSRTTGLRLEIASHETLQQVMLDRMIAAHKEGRPLQDGLLLQRTVAKANATALIRGLLHLGENEDLNPTDPNAQAAAASIGLRLVPVVDLSIRKSTNK